MKVINSFGSFAVKDLKKAKGFYSETLGLAVDEMKEMELLQIKTSANSQVMVYEKEDHKPAEFTVFNLVVAAIDEAVDELGKNGVEVEEYQSF